MRFIRKLFERKPDPIIEKLEEKLSELTDKIEDLESVVYKLESEIDDHEIDYSELARDIDLVDIANEITNQISASDIADELTQGRKHLGRRTLMEDNYENEKTMS